MFLFQNSYIKILLDGVYKKIKQNKKVLFASFSCMDLAKNFNTTPLSLTLASQSFCKTSHWKLYQGDIPKKSSYGNSMELKK